MTRLDAALAELAAAIREEVRGGTASDPNAPERLYSVADAAAQLSIGRTALYSQLQHGHIRSFRIGGRRLVPASAITERIEAAGSTKADGQEVDRDAIDRPAA